MTSSIPLRDGRVVCLHDLGDPAGRPVFFCHGGGVGATGLFAASCGAAAREQHVRILAPDRPGLGGSTAQAHRTILDWAGDLEELADALHLESFAVVSHSGGAGYALACAWRMPQRVTSVSLVSAVASRPLIAADGQVPRTTKLLMWWLAAMPSWATGAMFGKMASNMERAPEKTSEAFLRRLPACERTAVANPAGQQLFRDCVAAAFRQGTAAAVHDLKLIFSGWGVPLEQVRQPVSLWHGEQDPTAPPAMARALARALPQAELHLIPNAGHLSTWLCHAHDVLAAIGTKACHIDRQERRCARDGLFL